MVSYVVGTRKPKVILEDHRASWNLCYT